MKRFLLAGLLAVALSTATLTPAVAATPAPPVTVVAAGDIACDPTVAIVTPTTCQQAATAALAAKLAPRYVFPLGDLVYPYSSRVNLLTNYDPTWGKLKSISKPVAGNHESTHPGYYEYWRGIIDPPGYYSFSTGSWHVVVLNTSSCADETTGICGDLSAQVAWLTADLAAHHNKCTVAMIHDPLWSYGKSATIGVRPLFAALAAGNVDLVVAAHDHNYQRFAAQTITGTASATGLTEIVAGTGGASQQPIGTAVPNRVAAFRDFGLLDLSLGAGGWSSSFRSISGAVRDPATGVCH